MKKSIALIGMPGAGKSTLGALLAKSLDKAFIDTDLLIQLKENKTLQEVLDNSDHLKLRAIETQVLLEADFSDRVIATGGSAVYSAEGMQHLKSEAIIIFLNVPVFELKRRINDFDMRGIAKHPEQNFEALYKERYPLYKQYADITVDYEGQDTETFLTDILAILHTDKSP